MRLVLALGAAIAATTLVAEALPTHTNHRIVMRTAGEDESPDTNADGWLSRDEAAASADRAFDQLDYDHNGRITESDHDALEREIRAQVDEALEGADVALRDLDVDLDIDVEDHEDCTTTTDTENGHRRTTIICREGDDDDDADRRGDREVRRNVTIIRTGGEGGGAMHVLPVPPVPPIPPVPPVPPIGPMFFMFGDSDESDLNGDGALSREEFRAQQLRFFEARDANGDGRVRFEAPPEPPEPPEPPAPPARRR